MSIMAESDNRQDILQINPHWRSIQPNERIEGYWYVHMKAAQNRYMRFLPYIAAAFPETAPKKGVIESPLVEIPAMKEWFNQRGAGLTGRVFLKDDARLPIAGTTAGRGGIHAVLHMAEVQLQRAGMLQVTDRYDVINTPPFREYLSRFAIQAPATGDLGLSVGRMADRMGFRTVVPMPDGAGEGEKTLLCPEDLLFGCSSAALRLKVQLSKLNIPIGPKHPLFLYLPWAEADAPAGITFGLRQLCGDDVHCFFARPAEDPDLIPGMAADRPSPLAARLMKPLLSGSFSVEEEKLLTYQKELREREGLILRKDACAGFRALEEVCRPGTPWAEYLEAHSLTEHMSTATHILWGTAGERLSSADLHK